VVDTAIICDSVKKTGRCVIVEVGWPQAGFGGEIAYQVQRQCLDALDAPVERVCSDDVPMPYAKNLEDEVQPQVKDVVAAVRRALYLD
jgi:pyruvate dehydrogenase E1 component beta subunit